jgi:hypothetical protein
MTTSRIKREERKPYKNEKTLITGEVHRASNNGTFLTSYIVYTSGTVYLEVQFVAYGNYAFGD